MTEHDGSAALRPPQQDRPHATAGGPNEFHDRVAIVSGGARGIGFAIAQALVAAGARVAVLDALPIDTAAAGSSSGDAPGASAAAGVMAQVRYQQVDVSDAEAVEAAIAWIEAEIGPIDYGVSNAGILHVGTAIETTAAERRRIFDVNALGAFSVLTAVARRMASRRRGAIVTVSSNASYTPRHAMSAYAASKAALSMFTRCLGLELAPLGIRCNVVCPGSTRTPMQTGMWTTSLGERAVIDGSLEAFRTGIPLGRLAEPEQIADVVLFLLSQRASHITMTELPVDGGATPR